MHPWRDLPSSPLASSPASQGLLSVRPLDETPAECPRCGSPQFDLTNPALAQNPKHPPRGPWYRPMSLPLRLRPPREAPCGVPDGAGWWHRDPGISIGGPGVSARHKPRPHAFVSRAERSPTPRGAVSRKFKFMGQDVWPGLLGTHGHWQRCWTYRATHTRGQFGPAVS